MKELKDYSIDELRLELLRREEEAAKKQREEAAKIPTKFWEYESLEKIDFKMGMCLLHVHVDDGSEGLDYLVHITGREYEYQYDEDNDEDEKMIENTIKHHLITEFPDQGWDDPDFGIESIQIYLLGYYGIHNFLKITRPDDND